MSMRGILVAIGAVAVLQSPSWARAGVFPFSITQTSGGQISVECAGPWGRVSLCHAVPIAYERSYPFYSAEDNIFSAVGTWWCAAYRGSICNTRQKIAELHFCGPGAGNSPPSVDLTVDERTLTVNQAASCTGTVVKSVLGQNGELALLLLALGFPADLDDDRMGEIGQLLAGIAASIMADAGISARSEA